MRGREYDVDAAEVKRLVRTSGCAAYAWEFVNVAQLKSVPLITFDIQILSNSLHVAMDSQKFIKDFS